MMAFVHTNLDAVLIALLAMNVLLLILLALTLNWLGRLSRLYRRLTKGTSGGNLEEVLNEHMATVADVSRRIEALEQMTAELAAVQQRCLQHVGVVRFDAFEEVGGEQSFALALLDARNHGLVMSSVFSRTDVRVYAKALVEGRPSHSLTKEEQQAIGKAAEG